DDLAGSFICAGNKSGPVEIFFTSTDRLRWYRATRTIDAGIGQIRAAYSSFMGNDRNHSACNGRQAQTAHGELVRRQAVRGPRKAGMACSARGAASDETGRFRAGTARFGRSGVAMGWCDRGRAGGARAVGGRRVL